MAWRNFQKGEPVFAPVEGKAYHVPQKGNISEERLVYFIGWFIKMRWLACIVSSTLILVTTLGLEFLERKALGPLIISVTLLITSNIVYTILMRRRRFLWYLREAQIILDLVILTIMLHFSGGIENPLFMTYMFHVIIGGILLNRKKCFAIVIT